MGALDLSEDPILAGLNPPQRQAVLANDGPVLVLAGAGSGKTRAITHKIAWLVQREGFAPWEILAVTFTNKAAAEMRERTRHLIGEAAEDVWLGTFHRIGVRLLRRHGELVGVRPQFTIYDQDDQRAMVTRVMASLGIDKKSIEPRAVARFIDQAKQRARGPDEAAEKGQRDATHPYVRIYKAYEEAMRQANAVDFGDLLMLPLRLMQRHPLVASEYKQRWRYILVDEFQDTNRVQYELLRAVLNDARRICVVGDDDQSIYRWRGAEVENILGFEEDFPGATVIRLEQNYRSSAHILEAAGELISRNAGRHPKTLWTERGEGEKVRLHEAATDTTEAEYVARRIQALRDEHPLREMAIFYRTHAQSRALEDALRQRGLPYEVVGGLKFYERAEVKDLLAYLRVLTNPDDVVGFERIINTPTRGIGAATVARVHATAADSGLTFWEALRALARTGSKGDRKKLGPFVALIEELTALAEEGTALAVAQRVLELTGYVERLKAEGTAEADARMENLHELLNAIDEFGHATGNLRLDAFLEQVALVSDIDRADLAGDAVVMMTAHTAKGLEFDVVFVTGLEDGLFPHFNSREETRGVEEERRLAYVAMTRARHKLHLTYTANRRRFGRIQPAMPSPFLDDLPRACLEVDRGGLHRPAFHAGWRPEPGRPEPRPEPRAEPRGAEFAQDMPDYEDYSQEEVVLGPRSTVFHVQFGEGCVLSVSGTGRDANVRVRFPDGREKTIRASFLTPVSS